MNCPRCGKPMVVGTIIDGDERRSYKTCPYCLTGRACRPVPVVHPPPPVDDGAEGADAEEQIRDLVRVLPADGRARLLAFAAIQGWHTKCVEAIVRAGGGPGVALLVRRWQRELLAEVRRVAAEGGAS